MVGGTRTRKSFATPLKERGGRAARCMGSAPVAEMLASEARRSRASVAVRSGASRVQSPPLYAFSWAIDRESPAGLGNSLKLALLGSVM